MHTKQNKTKPQKQKKPQPKTDKSMKMEVKQSKDQSPKQNTVTTKIPLSSFCVGWQHLGMGPALKYG